MASDKAQAELPVRGGVARDEISHIFRDCDALDVAPGLNSAATSFETSSDQCSRGVEGNYSDRVV
jgi:hypothetical protein